MIVSSVPALLWLPTAAAAEASRQPPSRASCTVVGTPGNDVLRGTRGDDVICGLGGNDLLLGLAGDDILRGGPGDDTLVGGPGDDTLAGQAGKDLLVDRLGVNSENGGTGHDRCIGTATTAFAACELVFPRAASLVATASGGLSAASPAAAAPRVPALSADAAVSADGITVQFDESGLNPLEPIIMSVTASKETTSECVTPGPVPTVLLSTTASGSATEVTNYVADPDGRIAASRRLSVTAAGPVVNGLPCALRTTYFATVVVTDLSHGVSVTVERRG